MFFEKIEGCAAEVAAEASGDEGAEEIGGAVVEGVEAECAFVGGGAGVAKGGAFAEGAGGAFSDDEADAPGDEGDEGEGDEEVGSEGGGADDEGSEGGEAADEGEVGGCGPAHGEVEGGLAGDGAGSLAKDGFVGEVFRHQSFSEVPQFSQDVEQ